MNQIDLLKVNVNDHKEEKNGLSYLSWAWAWAEVLKADPKADFEVQTFFGNPFMTVGDTAMVWVTVTIFEKPITCWLPVMNSRNAPISIAGRTFKDKYGKDQTEKVDAFNVNTSLMRCLTKTVAMHGLGLYIYAGEDLPEKEEKEAPKEVMGDLMTKEHAPVYKKIADKHDIPAKKRPQPTEWDNGDESRKLFADSMIEYTNICKDVESLNSYWISNQLQLESLKKTHLSLYQDVLSYFANLKQQLKEAKNG
jgi:hypothetical protein